MKCIRILWWTLQNLLIRESNAVGEIEKPENGEEQTQMQALTLSPIDAACHRQILCPLIATATVVAPAIVYDCRLLVAFYRPAMTDTHLESPLAPRSALLPGSQSAHQMRTI